MTPLPPGQRALDRFPRFGTNQGPPPAVPAAPVIELAGAVDGAGDDRRRRPRLAPAADAARRLPLRRRVVGARAALGGRSATRGPAAVAAATHVRFAGLDGHWSVMLLEDALADDVLLADRLDGAPLDAKHGAPVRLVAPAHYGFVNVKHLCRIELLTAEPAQSHGAASGLADLGLRLLGYRRFTRARVWEEERHAVLPARVIRLIGRVVGP